MLVADTNQNGVCGNTICNEEYMKYIGFDVNNFPLLKTYFCKETLALISEKVSHILQGVDPEGRKIVVPYDKICHVMSAVYNTHRPNTGDIFTRYNILPGTAPVDIIRDMIDRTIQIITSTIRNELGIIENNEKLTVWTTVLGDFNEEGLRSHSIIKLRRRRPNRMEFNMNY